MKSIILSFLISSFAFGAGKIMDSDVKSEADILAAGGTKSQLINDAKIYVTANSINKTLDDAITDGDIGGGSSPVPLTKGQLITHDGTTYVAANACGDGQIIEWDSTQANGFKCVTKPLELKYIKRITSGTTWTRSSANVKKVEFYYCGGGGAGNPSTATGAVPSMSYGPAGNSGQLRKCTIYNPSSTIAVTIGSGGTSTSSTAPAGGNTTIAGCATATGGAALSGAGSLVTTGLFSTGAVGNPYNTAVTSVDPDNFVYPIVYESNLILIPSENRGRGYSGQPIYYAATGLSTTYTAGLTTTPTTKVSVIDGSCAGGYGGFAQANDVGGNPGGDGSNGQIVSHEYE